MAAARKRLQTELKFSRVDASRGVQLPSGHIGKPCEQPRIVALPALLEGREASEVLAISLEALVENLKLECAYARVQGVKLGDAFDLVRSGVRGDPDSRLEEVRTLVARCSGIDSRQWVRAEPNPIGVGDVQIAGFQLGVCGDLGVLVAMAARRDFPTQAESSLLHAAVHHVVGALTELRLKEEVAPERVDPVIDHHGSEAELVAMKHELAAEHNAMRRLHDLGSLWLTNAGLQTIVGKALDATIELQRADFGIALLFDAHSLDFYVVRGFGSGLSELLISAVSDERTAIGRSLGDRERVVIEDVELEPRFESERDAARTVGFRAVQSTPLLSRNGEALGVISTHFREPHRPSDRELSWMDLYAQQAAAMIDRTRTEEAVRRSEFYLAEGEKISHTGSWRLSVATYDVFSSSENRRIFGFDTSLARPAYAQYFERMHPEDREMVQRQFAQAQGVHGDFEAGYRILWPDQTVRHVHGLARPIFDDRGQLVEYIGINMDVTARKHADDELRRAQAELAHVNRAMMMGELVASIAHEVNQPLAAVVLSAKACLRWLRASTPNILEAKASARLILHDALRASEVLSRIRSLLTRGEPAKAALQVEEILREVVSFAQSEARLQDVSLQLCSVSGLPFVLGDRIQLQQVVLNLVVNALEAMRSVERERRLEIGAERYGPGHVRVSVRDSGPGLEAADRDRIFDAFYTTKALGLGMGLAISRSIVHANGGQLWSTANEDAGETFHFTFPIAAPVT